LHRSEESVVNEIDSEVESKVFKPSRKAVKYKSYMIQNTMEPYELDMIVAEINCNRCILLACTGVF